MANAAAPADGAAAAPVLLHCDWMNRQLWFDELRSAGVPVAWSDDVADWGAVRFAVGWNFTPALLAKMPALRAIASLGAGVDHAMRPGLIPPGVDVLRIVDPLMAQRMATWVMWAVINFQRRMDEYARAQAQRRWDKRVENYQPRDNGTVRVGIMGFGVMGQAAAGLLTAAGYDVAAWARTPRAAATAAATAMAAAAAGAPAEAEVVCSSGSRADRAADGGRGCCHSNGGGSGGGGGVEGVQMFAGRSELRRFVEQSDVLVCLLPLTPQTQGIIGAELLSWLPRGACVINAARGKHLQEGALLAALESGHVAGAVLDVFETEPLPPDSPLWNHPAVRITPHVSSITHVPNAAAQIADNYRRLLAGQPLLNVADKASGY